MRLVVAFTWLSGLVFLCYGLLCLASLSMVEDFRRFGLEPLRLPTGFLEVLGGAGLLVGLRWPPALWMGSSGLALLMLIAFGVRLHTRDGLAASLSSFALMSLNIYIFIDSWRAHLLLR